MGPRVLPSENVPRVGMDLDARSRDLRGMLLPGTVEDIVRALDENPELREALRARILSSELPDLHEKLAVLANRVEPMAEQLAAQTTRLNQLAERVDALAMRMASLDERFERNDRRLDRIEDALGVLKGAHARKVAERDVGLIARSLGLRERRVLSATDLFDLAAEAGADMNSGAMQSYLQADLVFEAADAQGETYYVAVEVSYTANGGDTGRALRNSVFLIRFTGCPCQPVVASLHVDDCVSDLLKSGRIVWYRIPREALEAA